MRESVVFGGRRVWSGSGWCFNLEREWIVEGLVTVWGCGRDP